MYFKQDESLAHSSLKFVLELAMQEYVKEYVKEYLNFVGRRVNEMHT